MKFIARLYVNAYSGLSPASWMLAFIMFVNRSGSMVLPFLSVYLTKGLHYGLSEAGILISIFGIGAMIGSFGGGYLSDKKGHFYIQLFSLLAGGALFFVVMLLRGFWALAAGLLLLSSVTEMLRPANISSISHYAKPENVTRAFSLNRMAVNLGFSIGPYLGGWAALLAYHWLFVFDGTTCIIAGLVFYFFFKKRTSYTRSHTQHTSSKPSRQPYKDGLFLLFIFCVWLFAMMFFQILFTITPYYVDIRGLSTDSSGLLLGLNGFVVFLVEMVIVYLVADRYKLSRLISIGLLLTGVGYVLLNLTQWNGILYISIIVLSLAEIMAMPFMATLTVNRSTPATRGKYMGMYATAYSVAFVLGPLIGTRVADAIGFDRLWYGIGVLSLPSAAAIYYVTRKMEEQHAKERQEEITKAEDLPDEANALNPQP